MPHITGHLHILLGFAPERIHNRSLTTLHGAKTPSEQENETAYFLALRELLTRSVSQCKMLGGNTRAGIGRQRCGMQAGHIPACSGFPTLAGNSRVGTRCACSSLYPSFTILAWDFVRSYWPTSDQVLCWTAERIKLIVLC